MVTGVTDQSSSPGGVSATSEVDVRRYQVKMPEEQLGALLELVGRAGSALAMSGVAADANDLATYSMSGREAREAFGAAKEQLVLLITAYARSLDTALEEARTPAWYEDLLKVTREAQGLREKFEDVLQAFVHDQDGRTGLRRALDPLFHAAAVARENERKTQKPKT